jgi:hypothetical protein
MTRWPVRPQRVPRLSSAATTVALGSPRAKSNPVHRRTGPQSCKSGTAVRAETVDTSVSKAIAALVRLGLESQESRQREFFKRLKENLANDDPSQQDRLVDEFRTLILGR